MSNRISAHLAGVVPGPIRTAEDFPPALRESRLEQVESFSTKDIDIINGKFYDFAGERVRILNLLTKETVDPERDFLLGMVAFQFLTSGSSASFVLSKELITHLRGPMESPETN